MTGVQTCALPISEQVADGALEVTGVNAEKIGELAAANSIVLHELSPVQASLEEAFMDLTRDDVEYHAHTGLAPMGAAS